MCTQNSAHDVYSSFVHKCQILEATAMSFCRSVALPEHGQAQTLGSQLKELRRHTCPENTKEFQGSLPMHGIHHYQ